MEATLYILIGSVIVMIINRWKRFVGTGVGILFVIIGFSITNWFDHYYTTFAWGLLTVFGLYSTIIGGVADEVCRFIRRTLKKNKNKN